MSAKGLYLYVGEYLKIRLISLFYEKSLVILLVFVGIFLFNFFSLSEFIFAATEIPGYADVYINPNGTMVGYNLLWVRNYSGTSDEFGGIVIENGVGYAASKTDTGNITAFNATTGDLIWTVCMGESDGTPLLDNQGNFVYVNIYNSGPLDGVYKLNKSTGATLLYNKTCTAGVVPTMVQNDNLIFGNCDSGTIYAYNKNNLNVNWSFSIGESYGSTTPLYYQDTLTIARYSGPYLNLNASTGTQIWQVNPFGGNWDIKPSIADETIYMGSNNAPFGVGAFNLILVSQEAQENPSSNNEFKPINNKTQNNEIYINKGYIYLIPGIILVIIFILLSYFFKTKNKKHNKS
jgi:outer membrane protein assembly factor BamB